MKRVLTALVLIPVVLYATFKGPFWLFAVLVSIFAILAFSEYLRIAELISGSGFRFITIASALLTVFLLAWEAFRLFPLSTFDYLPFRGLALVSFLLPLFVFWGLRIEPLKDGFHAAITYWFSLPYCLLPFLILLSFANQPFYLLYIFIVVWSGDIFAYYFGKRFGKHKLAPRISPGKSVEGAIASLTAATILGTLWFANVDSISAALIRYSLISPDYPHLSLPFDFTASQLYIHGILLSLILNSLAQLGDLVESMLKRSAGIKDSGNLLPGHGGVLDRVDALLFVLPVSWFYVHLFGYVPLHRITIQP